MAHAGTVTIRVLIFRDPTADAWVAQGLEYDICAQAKTIDQIHSAFEKMVTANIAIAMERGEKPFAGIPKAPQKFFRAFRESIVNSSLTKATRDRRAGRLNVPTQFQPVFRMTEKIAAVA